MLRRIQWDDAIRRLHSDFKDSRSLRRAVGRKDASVFSSRLFGEMEKGEMRIPRTIFAWLASDKTVYRIYSFPGGEWSAAEGVSGRICELTKWVKEKHKQLTARFPRSVLVPFFMSRRVASCQVTSVSKFSHDTSANLAFCRRVSHSLRASIKWLVGALIHTVDQSNKVITRQLHPRRSPAFASCIGVQWVATARESLLLIERIPLITQATSFLWVRSGGQRWVSKLGVTILVFAVNALRAATGQPNAICRRFCNSLSFSCFFLSVANLANRVQSEIYVQILKWYFTFFPVKSKFIHENSVANFQLSKWSSSVSMTSSFGQSCWILSL